MLAFRENFYLSRKSITCNRCVISNRSRKTNGCDRFKSSRANRSDRSHRSNESDGSYKSDRLNGSSRSDRTFRFNRSATCVKSLSDLSDLMYLLDLLGRSYLSFLLALPGPLDLFSYHC